MKPRMIAMVAAVLLLVAANALKYGGVFGRVDTTSVVADLKKISINYQKPGTLESAAVKNNIFNGRAENEGSYSAPSAAAQKSPTPSPKIWPHFKISGFAANDGKKCAFFSGSDFSGAVIEGAEFDDGYMLESIKDSRAVIVDRSTGEKKTITLEGK
jgi:hypothetical protein